ncbi:MAG TPA: ATP-binding cassette domain-containing protein [Ilumatobacteraceae bacterium]|nr:ATP-binding cassette domain-containing protein [Ilumatobacteraceae bacterium]
MLTARNLSYRLPDGRELFRSVELALQPGDAVAITGPSGTGKSTLLWLLGGLLQPTTGAVDISTPNPHPIAWVLQGLYSLSARTVLHNTMLCGVIDGAKRSSIVNQSQLALHAVGLSEFAATKIRALSGGELQRVAVARALASGRPVILADEPTNQLDRTNATNVMHLLAEERHKGRVVVIVTHDTASLPAGVRQMQLTPEGLTC